MAHAPQTPKCLLMSYVSEHSREFEPLLRAHARNSSVAFVRVSDLFPTSYEQSELLPTLRRAGVQSAIFLPYITI